MKRFDLQEIARQTGFGENLKNIARETSLGKGAQSLLAGLAGKANPLLEGNYKGKPWMNLGQIGSTLAGQHWLTALLIGWDAKLKHSHRQKIKSDYGTEATALSKKYENTPLSEYIGLNVADMGSQFGKAVAGKGKSSMASDLIALGTLGVGQVTKLPGMGGETLFSKFSPAVQETLQKSGLGLPLDLAQTKITDILPDVGLDKLLKNVTAFDVYRPLEAQAKRMMTPSNAPMVPGAPMPTQRRRTRRII